MSGKHANGFAEAYRRLTAPKPMADQVDLSGRSAVVTGGAANSIGYYVAKILAAWGADVVVTSLGETDTLQSKLRDELRAAGVDQGRLVAQPVDLADPLSVAAFAQWHREHHGDELDILVNNAGIFSDIAKRAKTPILAGDGTEVHWRVNFLGTFHLTSLLLPRLQSAGERTGDARIIITSSVVHEKGSNAHFFSEPPLPYNSWDAYAQSKLALVHLAFELQRRFADQYGLQTAAVHPGDVRSNLTNAGLGQQPVLRMMNRLTSPLQAPFFLSPLQGAQTTIACATMIPLRGGEYYETCAVSRASEETKDSDTARRLWDGAQEWVSSLPNG